MNTEIRLGHCLDSLRQMPDKSIHTIITSVPYWGLRSYGTTPQIWGGDPDCDHAWGNECQAHRSKPHGSNSVLRLRANQMAAQAHAETVNGSHCSKCNAWLGEHGLEPTMQLWLENALCIATELHRVLRDDGSLWLNCGDTYATESNGRPASIVKEISADDRTFRDKPFSTATQEIPSKNRLMLPARLAIALQEQGWYLRDEIVWSKANPIPSSARDRTCPAHEMVYLLTKQPRYYFDDIAILEPTSPLTNPRRKDGRTVKSIDGGRGFDRRVNSLANPDMVTKRMRRSVWHLQNQPFKEAHFATFPPTLIEPMIMASTSEAGCCGICLAPLKRIVVRTGTAPKDPSGKHADRSVIEYETRGWEKTCSCPTDSVLPAIVLDPFGGSGTVGLVANELGRNALLLELHPDFADIAKRRIPSCTVTQTKPDSRRANPFNGHDLANLVGAAS